MPRTILLLPMEEEPDSFLIGAKRLTFHLDKQYISDLPNFFVVTDSTEDNSQFELDPPQDVFGKLTLNSPKTASLFLTFRPPASHPRLIKKFTFEFSTKETIVFEIRSDDPDVPTDAIHSITMSQLIHAQEEAKSVLEVHPKGNFTYPGNYSVTVFTNDASDKKHIIPIIMPNFDVMAPRDIKFSISEYTAKLSWAEPKPFGNSCRYTVSAIPTKGKGVQQSIFVEGNRFEAVIKDLSPAVEYEFILFTSCGTGKSVRTVLAKGMTGPRVPGEVRNLQIELIKAGVVRLSWNPPVVLKGDSHTYTSSCKHSNADEATWRVTNDTTVTIEPVAPGQFSCFVYATSSVGGHRSKEGPPCKSVSIDIPSNLFSSIPTVSIKRKNASTIDLSIGLEEDNGIIAIIVTLDSYLSFAFYADNISAPVNIKHIKLSQPRNISVNKEEKLDSESENQKYKLKLLLVTILGAILLALIVGIGLWQYKLWRLNNDPLLRNDAGSH
ncbi:unnamed protein product [Rodentolepis nana]|uniref:Fibronectin type-III domain-containing protein n=1 Tax=Rodentolepis nana TaxID=102285 RepID=A0A3P7V1A7_RODNA|nr:unnamed protein product [Rodentolepis nana]